MLVEIEELAVLAEIEELAEVVVMEAEWTVGVVPHTAELAALEIEATCACPFHQQAGLTAQASLGPSPH